jgi:hypothetical protein
MRTPPFSQEFVLKRVNIIFGLIGIALCAYIFGVTASFPEDNIMKIGPGFFPRLLAAGLGIFSLILIIQNILGKSQEQVESAFSIKDPGIRRSIVALTATILYGVIMGYLGFVITSIFYLVFMMYLMKMRKGLLMTGVASAVTLVVYTVFSVLLKIALPEGFWA